MLKKIYKKAEKGPIRGVTRLDWPACALTTCVTGRRLPSHDGNYLLIAAFI